MADEQTVKRVPYVAFSGVLSQVDRMCDEGIPEKIDRNYLGGMADGTQFQYRQAFRYLGLTTSDDQPLPLLHDLVSAGPADRSELFGKIMSTRFPELTGLPLDASIDDFFAVLEHGYGVTSDVQRRKMRTFFVAAADYAGSPISPDIRPTKARKRPGRRRVVRRGSPPRSQLPGRTEKTAASTPATRTDPSGQEAIAMPAKRQDISLGDAGSVSVIVNVPRWWKLSEDQFAKLRKLIEEVEALGDSGS